MFKIYFIDFHRYIDILLKHIIEFIYFITIDCWCSLLYIILKLFLCNCVLASSMVHVIPTN